MTFPQKDKNATRRSFFYADRSDTAPLPRSPFRPRAYSLARIILTGLTLRTVIAAVSARI